MYIAKEINFCRLKNMIKNAWFISNIRETFIS